MRTALAGASPRLLVLSFVLILALLVLARCDGVLGAEVGTASVYGAESGKRRADGRRFRPSEVGCAMRSRKLGSVVRVTALATGRSISCPINDRGPYIRGRILDLSTGAARALGVRGLARVRVE